MFVVCLFANRNAENRLGENTLKISSQDFLYAITQNICSNTKKQLIWDKLKAMLDMGVTGKSHRIKVQLHILMAERRFHFCKDFRNTVSNSDTYPVLCIGKLLNRLGVSRFYSTLGLTKGY